jgi:geranylgeranyl reductase family protein
MTRRYDVVVVGAGPAGSTCALRLSRAGASVLLVDRAKFPRDKPCGGAVTRRAALSAPCDVSPVVEDVVTAADLVGADGRTRTRESPVPIAYMTQRRRLDSFLVDQAAASGVDVRDGVGRVALAAESTTALVDGERVQASVLVGADGANGTAAESLGLGEIQATGIALEGNLLRSATDLSRYVRRGVVHFGVMRGGYGWIFPKGDHVNVGVGGWLSEAPTLRDVLRQFCLQYGLPFDRLESIRGHRLPMKVPRATIARGRACLIGDAAGLVDPLTGDGMYECFVSADLATQQAVAVLDGAAPDLRGYQHALDRRLRSHHFASWVLKRAFDRFPKTTYRVATSSQVWSVIRDLLTGELTDFESAAGRRLPLRLIGTLAARAHAAAPERLLAFDRS